MADALDPGDGALPATPPPPTWKFAKAPGGGIASPTYVDPTTGEYVDPFTGQGTGYNTSGDPVTPGSYTPAYDFTNQPPPPGFHWENGRLVQDAIQTPEGGDTPQPPTEPGAEPEITSGGGLEEVPISALPRITPPPPPDATGYTPQARGQNNRGGQGEFDASQSFSSLIPRAAGNDAIRPGDITGMRAQVPTWARGLMRSPYARALGRTGQSGLSSIGGFQPDAAPVDPAEEMRRQQNAILALGLPPVA